MKQWRESGKYAVRRSTAVARIPAIRPQVAGIDIGSERHFVCAPALDGEGREVIRLQPRNEKYRPQVVPAEKVSGLYKAVYRYQRVDE